MKTIALTILLLMAATASAQIPSADEVARQGGTLYVVAFPDTAMNAIDPRFPNRAYDDRAMFLLYSAVDATVRITARGYSSAVTTTGGRFSVVDLSASGGGSVAPTPIVTDHCRAVDHTFRVESDQPIILYQYLVTRFGTEAWTPAPVDAWGTEYYAAATQGEIGKDFIGVSDEGSQFRNRMFPAEILVVAAYDSTRVTIVPNGRVHRDCLPSSIMLRAGEAFQIESWVDTLERDTPVAQPDFGGSRIVASKPVGVISGNTRTQLIEQLAFTGNSYRNMQIEWLAPVGMQGTEFVYLPTWERQGELVRVYGTRDGGTRVTYTDSLGAAVSAGEPIERGEAGTITFRGTTASVIRSTQPAQVTMQSSSVGGRASAIGNTIVFHPTGGYMVSLTAREQWTSFAPFHAPAYPSTLVHFINVVTDTAHRNDVYLASGERFPFTRPIAGSDLVWGSMSVTAGETNWLEGRNGARFTGHVYGSLRGGGRESNTGPAFDEYAEELGIAYGYPLPPARIFGAADSLDIEQDSTCEALCLTIRSARGGPVPLRSLRLEGGVNAKISSVTPFPYGDTTMSVVVCVVASNPESSASALVVLKDRAGRVTRIPFLYFAQVLTPATARLTFEGMRIGERDTLPVLLTNATPRAIAVRSIRLQSGDPFRLIEPTRFPDTIAAFGSRLVVVEAAPTARDREYLDTLLVEMTCNVQKYPIVADTRTPCLHVGDLDFGTVAPEQQVTRLLRLSNIGGGVLRFVGTGGGVIELADARFSVSVADQSRLAAATLAVGEYIDVPVTFAATSPGTVRALARVHADPPGCRDTSVWTARVSGSVSAPAELAADTWLDDATPNPVSDVATIRFSLARSAHASLILYDERGARVRSLVDGFRAAGTHVVHLDVSTLPPGVYHYRLSTAGISQSRSLVRR